MKHQFSLKIRKNIAGIQETEFCGVGFLLLWTYYLDSCMLDVFLFGGWNEGFCNSSIAHRDEFGGLL